MGLLNLLSKSRFGLGGKTPPLIPAALPNSTLHNTTSLNGIPNSAKYTPSRLDLDGKTPSQYLENLPN